MTLSSVPQRTSTVLLRSEFSGLWLRIDPQTGLPAELGSESAGASVTISAAASFLLGGVDRRGSHGDLVYDGARDVGDIAVTGEITEHLIRDGRVFRMPVTLGRWAGEISYAFRAEEPALTWTWRWRPGAEAQAIRNFVISLDFGLDDPSRWRVNAPGNRLRPGLSVNDLSSGTPIHCIGGAGGSTGVVALTDDAAPTTLVVWPRSKDEIGESLLSRSANGVRLVYSTGLAATATDATDLEIDGVALDLVGVDWETLGGRISGWFDSLSIRTPTDRAEWTRSATIFEVQIGESIFAGGSWTYSPYPEISDLYADLPRIAALGFDTIQLMPRQPFPSYNVIDYDDIDVTFGNEADLVRVVEWCHEHEMRLILDVLMHGVIDKESIGEVAQTVRSGPWAELALAGVVEVEARKLTALEQAQLSWSRHILDFEASWRDGSPSRHPLTQSHPEWFCSDSRGNIIGVYTKAFDMSNPSWQQYFSDAMVHLMERLDIDGFRFDAPSYNNFPNWAPRTQTRPSLQSLGAVQLFRHLRLRLHDLNPDLMLYTEPNGALWRQSMDLNYNYDETWLPDSIFGAGGDHPPSRVRNGRDLAAWLRDRDRTLPVGSLTAHHIDSHDTFWWPLPSVKWRREQFGIDAARALMSAFALSGGPYMMFVGGEEGMEEAIRAVNVIRAERPEVSHGSHQYGAPATDSEDVYSLRHRDGGNNSIVLVNLSSRPVNTRLELADDGVQWIDLLAGDEQVRVAESRVEFAPYQARFLVPGT